MISSSPRISLSPKKKKKKKLKENIAYHDLFQILQKWEFYTLNITFYIYSNTSLEDAKEFKIHESWNSRLNSE